MHVNTIASNNISDQCFPLLVYPESDLFFDFVCVCVCRYNNKTYRIDDIKWDKFPTDTFPLRMRGEEREISFVDYYRQVTCLIKKIVVI